MSYKSILNLFIPPIIIKVLKFFFRKKKYFTLKGVYKTFDAIDNRTNYDDKEFLNKLYDIARLKFKNYHKNKFFNVSDNRSQITNLLPLTISMIDNNEINVLDYGGGLGEGYIHNLSCLPNSNLKYFIYDLPKKVILGNEILQNHPSLKKKIKFISNIENVNRLDILYFGSSIQYFSDYIDRIKNLLLKKPKYILFTDNYFTKEESFVTSQTSVINLIIPYNVFNYKEFILLFKNNNYHLIYKSVNFNPTHYINLSSIYNNTFNLLFKKNNDK